MKPAAWLVAAPTALALVALATAPASAQDVRIRSAVARVVVIVEDRADIGVEIEQGRSNLPALRVERSGSDVRIEGGLRRSRMGGNAGVRSCSGGRSGGQPGDGVVVEVRDIGRVAMEDAPLIVIRSPRAVDISTDGAVYGAIGRGARSVDLGAGGCGDWTVANVDGPLEVALGGSGSVRAGSSHSFEGAVGGSGSLHVGPTGAVEAAVGGSGDVRVARAEGPVQIAIGGSGDVVVAAGRAPKVDVSIAGSGDVTFDGVAGDVNVSIVGSGDVRIAEATGTVNRTVMGSGDIRIGR